MTMPEPPLGAIHNGREFLRRLIDHYSFRDEYGHPLGSCYEYEQAKMCFDYMAEWIEVVSADWEPSETQQGLIPIPDGYNEP